MKFLKELGAYTYDTVSNCRAAGGNLVPTIWVDVNKGDDAHPNVRCRLCVAETKGRTTLDLGDPTQTFSATPPYEALRCLVSMVMSPRTREEESHVLMFLDITRAHPHCDMKRKLWIRLPKEDPRSTEEGTCGLLLKSMYGCRDAGQNFELFTREVMVDRLGFECGVWSPCLYTHTERDLVAYIYGDNFVCKGTRQANLAFFNDLKDHVGEERRYSWTPAECR